ncbi:MAG: M50 family metallopeptidase [Magnetococcales bacterium]|nr:M50 family metallopeptidase [Magnetococcales bacterium]
MQFLRRLLWTPINLMVLAVLLHLALSWLQGGMDRIGALDPDRLMPYGLIVVGFGLFHFFLLNRFVTFWEVFFHELTHGLFALLTFNRIQGFRATMMQGGELTFQGRGNWVIYLAPYFFPLPAMALMPLSLLAKAEYTPYIYGAVSVGYGFFLVTAIRQFSFSQSDIIKAGRIFSVLMVPTLTLLIGLLMAFYLQGEGMRFVEVSGDILMGETWPWLQEGWRWLLGQAEALTLSEGRLGTI